MPGFFGQDSGPSEEELRQKEIEDAKQKAKNLRQLRKQENTGGITQFFGPGNPGLNIPGQTSES